jgi:predicted phosphoribosyltransferase
MGAIASGGVRVLNKNVVQNLGIPDEVINRVAAKEVRELERREREYRDGQPPVEVQGRTVILVDDGLATGSSMRVAVRAPKRKRPAQIVVAVPVGDPAACAELEPEVDQVICAVMPKAFRSVSQWYDDFAQTTDEVVRDLLSRTASLRTPTAV